MATTPTRAPRLSIAPLAHPRYGDAALEADLLATLDAALDQALQVDVAAERTPQPLVATLFALGDARTVPPPERVLTADLSTVEDCVLVELRLRLADAGLSRLRLSGAIGARIALRGIG